jgi:hypothetical protein
VVEQDGVEFLPQARQLPVAQAAPADHAAAAAEFLREVFSGDAGFEHEEDASEALAIGQALASVVSRSVWWIGWQEGLDDGPQFSSGRSSLAKGSGLTGAG